MDDKIFFEHYIEEALQEDNQIDIPDPERYIKNNEERKQISMYIDQFSDDFLDKIGYYLDARTHNFPEVDGVDINEYRSSIIDMILILKKKYNIEEYKKGDYNK